MNVFEQYLNGTLSANQLRDAVSTEGSPTSSRPTVQTPNLSNQPQWQGAAFDDRRQTTYDQRINQETHDRNNGNPFANVNISTAQATFDPVQDQLQHDQNYGGSNAFSRVHIAEYDPVRAQQEHDITTQQGRYAIEQQALQQQTQQPRTFADVPVAPKPTTIDPLDDTRQYQDQTMRTEETLRRDLDYDTHYNPANQRPLW